MWAGKAAAEPTQSVGVNPLGLAWGMFDVEYEKRLTDDSTWYAQGLYWSDESDSWTWSGIGAAGGYRKYFQRGKLFDGAYWGVNGGAISLSAEYEPVAGLKGDGSALFVFASGELGYKWLFTNNLTLSLAGYAGITMGSLSVEVSDTTTGITYSEDFPASGFGIGGDFRIGYVW